MLIRQGIGSARSGTGGASLSIPWTQRSGFSVVFDVKPNQTGYFNVWDIDNGSTAWLQLACELSTTGLQIWCDSTISALYTNANLLALGVWSRIGLVSNGATSLLIGKKATDSIITAAAINDNGSSATNNMWLANDGFSEPGDASYNHFKLWGRVLSLKEVVAEFQQGAPVSLKGLHTYLPLRNGQSDTSPHAVNKRGIITTPWVRTGAWASDRSQPPIPDLLHP